MADDPVEVLEAFERALFSGEDIAPFFADDAEYVVAGSPPIGGRSITT